MKTKEVKALRSKSVEDLNKMLQDLTNDIGQLQIDKALGKVKNVNEKRGKQKDIARINTILTLKQKEDQNV